MNVAESFTYKITTESELFSFDFNPVLQVGEELTSATCEANVMNGTDPNPELILSGTPVCAAGKATQRVIDGVSEVTYRLIMTAETNQGNTYVCVGDLPVYDADLV